MSDEALHSLVDWGFRPGTALISDFLCIFAHGVDRSVLLAFMTFLRLHIIT